MYFLLNLAFHDQPVEAKIQGKRSVSTCGMRESPSPRSSTETTYYKVI
jgi:hypothetical protein